MITLATLPPSERLPYFLKTQEELGLPAFYVEKDFWVCWMLERLFTTPALAPHLVFKGGTSLSKVWGAIQRFSEDIDLSVSPALFGITERQMEEASRSGRQKIADRLEKECCEWVGHTARAALENAVEGTLDSKPGGAHWLEFAVDNSSKSPTLLFSYPRTDERAPSYGLPYVKLELGSLTDQQPQARHEVAAFVDKVAPGEFADCRVKVVAVEIQRTLWEKATILHAEYHRPLDRPMRERLSRHYADFAALWRHEATRDGRQDFAMLERVARHKELFFKSGYSNYHSAKAGSLKLQPPEQRRRELYSDYAAMESMYIGEPAHFDSVLQVIAEAESEINSA